ncbi:MAG: PAS domain-containing protein [Bacteroidota bacterium]
MTVAHADALPRSRHDLLRLDGMVGLGADPALDRIARLAAQLTGTPTAFVTVVTDEEQQMPGAFGAKREMERSRSTPLGLSICREVCRGGRPLTIADGPRDPEFATHPAWEAFGVSAYLGVPIRSRSGILSGAVCAVSVQPREWTEADLSAVTDLAFLVEREMASRPSSHESASIGDAATAALFQLAVEASGFGVWTTDLRSGVTEWGPRCREIFGVGPREPASADRGLSLIHPEDRAKTMDAFDRALADPTGDYHLSHRLMRDDGTMRWVSTWGRIVSDAHGPLRITGLIADTTPQLRTEALLRQRGVDLREATAQLAVLNADLERRVDERTEQVRALAAALTAAEHRERRRIAHVLHEDLRQVIYGARVHVAAAARAGTLTADDETILGILERAATLSRTLSHDLAAATAEADCLDAALTTISDRFGETHGLTVALDLDDSLSHVCEASVIAVLAQIVRELLFNVVKHADTDRACLSGTAREGWVELSVHDDGCGFDAARVAHACSSGIGVPGLRERVRLFQGTFEIDAVPGGGTHATVRLPVQL